MTLLRARLGNYRIGLRVERLPHTLVVRSLFSHVADTAGVLNKFSNMVSDSQPLTSVAGKMCLFIDFDDKYPIDKIYEVLDKLTIEYNCIIHLFKTSENHYNAISTSLFDKAEIDEIMIKYMKYMDYRFVYVYNRDGYNAIRLIPKVVDGKSLRNIKYIVSMGNLARIQHNGLTHLLSDLFPSKDWNIGDFDDSTKDNLIIREYETINW
jgi:hypothetical protein